MPPALCQFGLADAGRGLPPESGFSMPFAPDRPRSRSACWRYSRPTPARGGDGLDRIRRQMVIHYCFSLPWNFKPDLPHPAGLARDRGQQVVRGERSGGRFVSPLDPGASRSRISPTMSRASSRTPIDPRRNVLPFAVECGDREPARRLHEGHTDPRCGRAARHSLRCARCARRTVRAASSAAPKCWPSRRCPRHRETAAGHGRISIGHPVHTSAVAGTRHPSSSSSPCDAGARASSVCIGFTHQAGCLPRDQKQPVSLAFVLDRDHGQHQKQIRDRAIGDPGLPTANNEASSARFRCRPEMFRMGSDFRLRKSRSPHRPGQPQCAAAMWRAGPRPQNLNKEPCRHLPRGKGARQPQTARFWLQSPARRSLWHDRCRVLLLRQETDLEQTCPLAICPNGSARMSRFALTTSRQYAQRLPSPDLAAFNERTRIPTRALSRHRDAFKALRGRSRGHFCHDRCRDGRACASAFRSRLSCAGREPRGRCAPRTRCSRRRTGECPRASAPAPGWTARPGSAGRVRRTAWCPRTATAP